MQLQFLGGTGTVTGSKYLVSWTGRRILVDCGLFQGLKELRLRNWEKLPVDPRSIDAVVLTHAHLDHTGYLPLLVRNGFRGPVYCTAGTADLCRILLPDSGFLQERDADYANRHGFSKHKPALPLYTAADAQACLELLKPVAFEQEVDLGGGLLVRFHLAGHILGASSVSLTHDGHVVVFSGDLGRRSDPIMLDPVTPPRADWVVMESTYGDRIHEAADPAEALGAIIRTTAARGGTVLIPAFAVGRTQCVLFHLQQLKASGRIPDLPMFVDSPMAINASEIFCRHLGEHRLSAEACVTTCGVARYVREVEDSKQLGRSRVPAVIISASGMATGGRILHHLKTFAPDPRSTIVLAGYQAAGTRGAALAAGAGEIKIHGGMVPVRAEIKRLPMLSGHADQNELISWLERLGQPPRRLFVTHGEPAASAALKVRIESEFGWRCEIPAHLDEVEEDVG